MSKYTYIARSDLLFIIPRDARENSPRRGRLIRFLHQIFQSQPFRAERMHVSGNSGANARAEGK